MKKILALILIVILVHFAPVSAVAANDVEANIKEQIEATGLTDYVLDMNVEIEVPERERFNTDATIPGVKLIALIIRPQGDTKLPTILIATGYRRENMVMMGIGLLKHGYNIMIVDDRGSGSSGGMWTSFDFAEQYDTAYIIDEWIPDQIWSDGRVGMMGPSYMGITQLFAAGLIEQYKDENGNPTGEPVHLKALIPEVAMCDTYRDIVMHGGNADMGFIPMWLLGTNVMAILPPALGENSIFSMFGVLLAHFGGFAQSIEWILDNDHIVDGPFFDHRSPMLYWPQKPEGGWMDCVLEDTNEGQQKVCQAIPEGTRVIPDKLPIFLTAGWFDIFTRGSLYNYQYGLANHDPTDKALVVGKWYHMGGAMAESIESISTRELHARWFDWKIKGEQDSFMKEFPVLIYVMGEDRWRAEKSWPLPESRLEQQSLYLSKLTPSEIEGDWFYARNDLWSGYNGTLVEEANLLDYNSAEPDPVLIHNPIFLKGKKSRSSIRWGAGIGSGENDWEEDERKDEVGVLTFTTDVFEEDIEISGSPVLVFWAKTKFTTSGGSNESHLFAELKNQKNVQWVVEINDVFTDGRAANVTSGWLNAWHRPYDPEDKRAIDPDYIPNDPFYDNSSKYPDPIEACVTDECAPYEYVVEIWPTDHVFKKGHRIRVSISASDDPHLLAFTTGSENTIVLDEDHQARFDFSVVKKEGEGDLWKWVDDPNDYLLYNIDDSAFIPNGDGNGDNEGDGNGSSPHDVSTQNGSDESEDNEGWCFIRAVF